jgi:DNA-binding beta-propeller fold protein YncE
VINGRTGAVTSTISVGMAAAGVAVSPRTGKIYVTNFQADTVSVIG